MSLFSTLYTVNATDKRVWVTIYDVAKLQHLDYGWVEPGSYRAWTSGNYACGSFYHVRGEVKSDAQGSDPNIYDTEVEINPQFADNDVPISATDGSGKTIFQQMVGTTDSVVTIHRGSGNYYWEHSGPVASFA
jgi:hypothetical protein